VNCQDIQKFAYTYLDEEFDERDRAEYQTHLTMCPPCRGTVERDAAFRDAVRRHLCPTTADPEVHDRVHRRLAEAHRKARMSRTLAVPLALAASLALAFVSWQAMRQGAPTEAPMVAAAPAAPVMTAAAGSATDTPVATEAVVANGPAVGTEAAPAAPAATDTPTLPGTAVAALQPATDRQPDSEPVLRRPAADPSVAANHVSDERSAGQVMGGSLNADSLAQRSPFGAIRSASSLRAMVRSHIRPLPPEVRGPAALVQRFLRERLPYVGPPPIADGVGVQLHGARLSRFAGRPVVRYYYEAFGKPLTVFQFVRTPGQEPFEDPEVEQASPGDPKAGEEGVLLDRLAGYSIVHSLKGGELTCLISELGGDELHNLIRAPTVL